MISSSWKWELRSESTPMHPRLSQGSYPRWGEIALLIVVEIIMLSDPELGELVLHQLFICEQHLMAPSSFKVLSFGCWSRPPENSHDTHAEKVQKLRQALLATGLEVILYVQKYSFKLLLLWNEYIQLFKCIKLIYPYQTDIFKYLLVQSLYKCHTSSV